MKPETLRTLRAHFEEHFPPRLGGGLDFTLEDHLAQVEEFKRSGMTPQHHASTLRLPLIYVLALWKAVEEEIGPAGTEPEPKVFPRTPTWVITDWGKPESRPGPPKFSISDVMTVVMIFVVFSLFVGWVVRFIIRIDSPRFIRQPPAVSNPRK